MNEASSRRMRGLCAAALVLAVLAVAPSTFAQPGGKLPQRNLLVEVRQGDESSFQAEGAGLRSGAVTIGTDGQARAQAGVQFDARSRDASAAAVTQLRVLNGAQGMLSVGSSVPVMWFEGLLGPEGPSVVAGQRLQDTGRRVAVRPSWPGGTAPVTVEVSTESSALAGGGLPSRYAFDGQPLPSGSVESTGLLTTLQLPLGTWTTVASEDERQTSRSRGVISSGDAARERRRVVQMRVTAP